MSLKMPVCDLSQSEEVMDTTLEGYLQIFTQEA